MKESVLFLILAIILTTLGQISYKFYARNGKKKIFIILSFIGFIFVPYCSYKALTNLSIDTVYMSTAIVIVLLLIASKILFNEHIPPARILGALLVLAGIIIYNI